MPNNPGETTLGQIDEITLKDINILYDFKISSIRKDDKITVSYIENTIITSVYPTEIDFNKQNSYTIIYETENPERLTGIKLNKDSSSELQCANKIGAKVCNVTNAHFQKSGNYYTYHDNSLGTKSISYEITTIKVIKKEREENENNSETSSYAGAIAGSVIGAIVLIGLIIFLIWMYKKKCAKNDNKNIEEKKAPLKSQEQIELNEKPKELE